MKKRPRLLAFILLFLTIGLIILGGCTSATFSLGGLGELKGIVTDARSGQNLQGVYVEADSYDYYDDYYDYDYTDGSGSYSIPLPSGTYDVYFELDGYYTEVIENIYITEPFSRSLDIQLTPIYSPTPTETPTPTPIGDMLAENPQGQQVSVLTVMSDGTLQQGYGNPIYLPAEPDALRNVPDKGRLYVVTGADGENGAVYGFDTDNSYTQVGDEVTLSSTDGQPFAMVHYLARDMLFVSRKLGSGVLEEITFNGDTVQDQKAIDITYTDPQGMAIDQNNGFLFVACRMPDKIISYDIENDVEVPGTVNVTDPAGLAYHSGKQMLYVISGDGAFIRTLDVSDPQFPEIVGDTTIPQSSGIDLVAVTLDEQLNRLFTLEKEGTIHRVRAWNVNGNPPYPQVSNPVWWDSPPGADIMYFREGKFIMVSLDDGNNGGGIRVYDAGIYPAGQMLLVNGSPFESGNAFFKMDQ